MVYFEYAWGSLSYIGENIFEVKLNVQILSHKYVKVGSY